MATKTTIWHPNTCACVLQYDWDDTQPATTRTHTNVVGLNVCGIHAGLTGQALLDAVAQHNRDNP